MKRFFGEAGPVEVVRTPVSAVTSADIVIHPLSGFEWRVCDGRLPEHDAACLLGYIEKQGDRYDVLRLGHGARRSSFPTVRLALAYFVSTAADTGPDGQTEDAERIA